MDNSIPDSVKMTDVIRSIILEASPNLPEARVEQLVDKYLASFKHKRILWHR